MIDTIAAGGALEGESRPAVMQRLVRCLAATKGKLSDQEFAAFQDQGITVPEMIAVIGEIAHCTLTNYFNRLAGTDLDDILKPYEPD